MSSESLGDVPTGQRVTVRRRSDDGRPTDTVGVLTGRDDESPQEIDLAHVLRADSMLFLRSRRAATT